MFEPMDFIANPKHYKQYLDFSSSEEYLLLQQFYHTKTIFDILGVARQENPHSSFLAWLLDSGESHNMGDFPLRRFLETLCFAYQKYGSGYLDLENATYKNLPAGEQGFAQQRLLFFPGGGGQEDLRRRLMQGSYRIERCAVQREKSLDSKKGPAGKRRADILIDLSLSWDKGGHAGRASLVLLIENKIKSTENRKQTTDYLHYLLNSEETRDADFVVPVYLYPVSNKVLSEHSRAEGSQFPCASRLFLLLNYQYLMDGVLAPCRMAFRGKSIQPVLDDYTACLGKSISAFNESESGKTSAGAEYLVMAVGPEEKRLSLALWERFRPVLIHACLELNPEADADCKSNAASIRPFLIRDEFADSDTQFYRTVLSAILPSLENEDSGDNAGANAPSGLVQRALESKMILYAKQEDGSLWKFASARRGRNTLGALGYVILKQYFLNHSNAAAADVLDKLKGIRHSWLKGILVTGNQLKELASPWLTRHQASPGTYACSRYYAHNRTNGVWTGCPVNKHKSNPVHTADDPACCTRHECPLCPSRTNRELYDWYWGKDPAGHSRLSCYYEFCNYFFVGRLAETLRELGLDPEAAKILEEPGFHFNDSFGPIHTGRGEIVFVARYWAMNTLEPLLQLPGMEDYVSSNPNRIKKSLSFTETSL